MPKAERSGVVATNRKARHTYDILDTVEAGIVLHGSEVKSLREAQVQMGEAYASVDDGEVWLHNVHIPPYAPATRENHEPERPRKVLVHINNTNPILLEDSPEREQVVRAGVEVAYDGLEVEL